MEACVVLPIRSSVELKLSVELPIGDEVVKSFSVELTSKLEDCSVLVSNNSVVSIEDKDVVSISSLVPVTLSDDATLSVETTDDDSWLELGKSDVTGSELLESDVPVDIWSEEGVDISEVVSVGGEDSDSDVSTVSDVSAMLVDVSDIRDDDSDVETAETLDISDDDGDDAELSSLAAVVDSSETEDDNSIASDDIDPEDTWVDPSVEESDDASELPTEDSVDKGDSPLPSMSFVDQIEEAEPLSSVNSDDSNVTRRVVSVSSEDEGDDGPSLNIVSDPKLDMSLAEVTRVWSSLEDEPEPSKSVEKTCTPYSKKQLLLPKKYLYHSLHKFIH